MSSLYYQHRQHEEQQQHFEQQQRRLERELHHQQQQEQQQQHYHYQQQEQPQEPYQNRSYQQALSYSDDYRHEHEDHRFGNHGSARRNNNDAARILPCEAPLSKREEALDSLVAMIGQERKGYDLDAYFPRDVPATGPTRCRQQNIINGGWREKICQWSYNVVDHFDLPREIVSISLNYFDRYMATLSSPNGRISSSANKPSLPPASSEGGSGDLALLASLGTLHLATKVHATNHNDYDPALGPLEEQHHKVPSLATLANLSRGQFGPASILEMERILLGALQWRLHPPTLYALVTFLLKLVPSTRENPRSGIKPALAVELFEVAMYIAELSVCDAYFVERQVPSSTIALAAIVTAMDELLAPQQDSMLSGMSLKGTGCFTELHRSFFLATCSERLGLGRHHSRKFGPALDRLRSMYLGASVTGEQTTEATRLSDSKDAAVDSSQQPRSRTNSYNPPTSPSSIADMSLSTINSTIHSMADTTISNAAAKRGDSMVSSIACQSRETIVVTTSHEDDEDLHHHHQANNNNDYELYDAGAAGSDDQYSHYTNSNTSHTNFRYSPSPPRDNNGELEEAAEAAAVHHYRYGEELHQASSSSSSLRRNHHTSQHSSATMSCSPIVASALR